VAQCFYALRIYNDRQQRCLEVRKNWGCHNEAHSENGRQTNTASFAYDSLISAQDEIRLLRLHSSANNNEITCELERYPLALAPEYRAISYCWGPPGGNLEIKVNGYSFIVRKNLFDMLNQLVLLGESRMLWIDAICIDQSFTTERNYQVGLMGTIYKRAYHVVAFLGIWINQAPISIKLMKDILYWKDLIPDVTNLLMRFIASEDPIDLGISMLPH
jgi:Heterokaryon incompatibility protein (HET)